MSQPTLIHVVVCEPCDLCKREIDRAALTPVTRKGDLREYMICTVCWIEYEDKFVPYPLTYKLKTNARKRKATTLTRPRGRLRTSAGDSPDR